MEKEKTSGRTGSRDSSEKKDPGGKEGRCRSKKDGGKSEPDMRRRKTTVMPILKGRGRVQLTGDDIGSSAVGAEGGHPGGG